VELAVVLKRDREGPLGGFYEGLHRRMRFVAQMQAGRR
jgi:hypothetical protein